MKTPAALVLGTSLMVSTGTVPAAQERYALIVSGATGGPKYAQQFEKWSGTLSASLLEGLEFDRSNMLILRETPDPGSSATAGNVRLAVQNLRNRLRAGDLLLVVLLGHGTFDGRDAKFNLVGPDLDAAEWAGLLQDLPGRLIFVNTSAASFPFLGRLSAPGRIVISATDSPAQRFDTIFGEQFAAAFVSEPADIDKNGRVSIWEAFAAAAGGVRRHYQQRGQLATERALLDDTGDGIGREAAAQGEDGALASRTYLDPPRNWTAPTDEVLVNMLQRRASLTAEVEELQLKKAFMPEPEYAREFERLMLAIARTNRDIRARTKS